MNIAIESDFPRGNRRRDPTEKRKATKRKQQQLFMNTTKKRKKKNKVETDVFELEYAPVNLELASIFNRQTLREGIVVLGCIQAIKEFKLQIELPNLIPCSVKIHNISDHLTNAITKQTIKGNVDEMCTILKEIFKEGQFVPVKIQNVHNDKTLTKIIGSINPRDVNDGKLHDSLAKGVTIWANVVDELDHGYELSAGIQNCRIFLPFKNIDDNQKYHIGAPLFCIIHKYQHLDNMSTLSVSAKREHLTKCQLDNINFNNLLPGMKVEFIIEELQLNGVKGKVFATYDGFIDKKYQFGLKNHFKEGKQIWAYVLFVDILTGVIYLTLRGLDLIPGAELEVGKILTATVSSTSSRGVYLKLNATSNGFVTKQRLYKTITYKNIDFNHFLETTYEIGSKHKCVILQYNRMEEIYICTFESNVIEENMYTKKDLKIGEKYMVTITESLTRGLLVNIGRIRGIVPNLHLSNSEYNDNIKKKFQQNQQVNARLLSNDSGQLLFTLKPDLVESDDCLTDIKGAVLNKQYVGYVIDTSPTGVLVGFYGNVNGWIKRSELNFGNIKSYNNPEQYFFIGQIVHVWIIKIENDEIQLSLITPALRDVNILKIGQQYHCEIIEKDKSNLIVNIDDNEKIIAVLPSTHLSRNINLSQLLYQHYKIGCKIDKTICINNNEIPSILSRREYLVVQSDKMEYEQMKFENLNVNMLIRVSINKHIDNDGIVVDLPLKDYEKSVFIPQKYLTDQVSQFEFQQCILAKIIAIDNEKTELTLDTRPEQLGIRNIDYSIKLLISYINDIKLIRKLRGTKPYKIGTKVCCVVETILNDHSCIVTLPNNTRGRVPSYLCPNNIKVNSKINGIVLGYNVVDNNSYVSLRETDCLKINPKQDGNIMNRFNRNGSVTILLITDFYVLGLLNDSQFNNQLVYLPVNLNENHRFPYKFYDRNQINILLVKKYKGKLFGIPDRIVKLLEQSKINEDKMKKTSKRIGNKNTEELLIQLATQIDDNDEQHHKNHRKSIANNIEIEENSNDEDDVNITPVLSSINEFYVPDELKSDDIRIDDDFEEKLIKPTVTLSKAEWQRQEEERIRRIEQELADPTATPQTAEQFERLLLANPNSIELWLKYIAMFVSATELNKARAVGDQALEKISAIMVEDKLQIWIALLNMENLYGTKETFETLFERATKCNETFDIYIKVIKMLANAGKITEMEEKIRKLRNKEKQNVQMWLEIGQIYYNLNKYREARNIQEAALKSITDKKRQFEIILRFGIMEFQYGELEHAVQHFETIVDIYTKKINIWTIYIDQLIKKKEYDMARNVLERAIRQKFPVKNMRTLYQKFISFEEQFGNDENVKKIKQMAKKYVDKINSKS